jgi:hypothetical protein
MALTARAMSMNSNVPGSSFGFPKQNTRSSCHSSIRSLSERYRVLADTLRYGGDINGSYLMFLGSKVRLVRKADNLTAIYEPTV